MKIYRKYVFAIVFLRDKTTKLLLLHRMKNWEGWEFLKGGVLPGERELNCLKREIKEETGKRRYKLIAKTQHIIKYKWPKGFVKDNHIYHGAVGNLFLVEVFDKKIKVDRNEHDEFKWVDKKDFLKLLTHNERKRAFNFILKKYKI